MAFINENYQHNQDFRNKNQFIDEPGVEDADEIIVKTCKFHLSKFVFLLGFCSSFGSCRVGNVNYFGSYCHGKVEGGFCQAETEQFTAVSGTCSAGGHCKGLHGQVRLHHEACTGSRGALGSLQQIDRVKQFLRKNIKSETKVIKPDITAKNITQPVITLEQEESNFPSISSSKCRGLYNPSAYQKLENICTDCYNLYKEPEVYTYCMSGCFDSSYFLTCVKGLMMEEEMVVELVNMVGK